MPGPGKTPNPFKLIAGTARPDREAGPAVELPLVAEIPPPPDWLPNAFAVQEWERLSRILFNAGLLTEGGLSGLAVMCAHYGDMVDGWSRKVQPTGADKTVYATYLNHYGLTPLAQGKVKAGGEGKKENPFSRNGKRPDTAA